MRDLLNPLLPLWGVCEYEGDAVIMTAFPYLLPDKHYAGRNISRYAVVRDYHEACGARLERACALLRAAFPGETFHWHCDSTALPEVALAEKAGLGVRGKHGLLITKEYGSWVFLGEIITTVKISDQPLRGYPLGACGSCGDAAHRPPTGGILTEHRPSCFPQGNFRQPSGCPPWGAGAQRLRRSRKRRGGVREAADRFAAGDSHCQLSTANCAQCNACTKACPTGALSEAGFEKARCLSHITQRRGALSPEEQALMARVNTAWGCDLCQEACPRNYGAEIDPLPEFLLDPIARVTEDTPLAGRAWAWRGEEVIRRNIRCILLNTGI